MNGYNEERFLAVTYPLGGDTGLMVGPELVKTRDYLHFDLAYQTRAYFALPDGYQVLKEYPLGLAPGQALRKFVRDFPPKFIPLGVYTPRSAGWIRPNGDFYPGTNGHYTIAQYICASLWMGPGGEEFLADQGWCRIHYTGQVTPPSNGFYRAVTMAQIQKVRSLIYSNPDPDWREALRTFIYTCFRAKREAREEADKYINTVPEPLKALQLGG